MAELITIARPYARAAFQSAGNAAAPQAWSRFLANAARVVADERVAQLIGYPRVSPGELIDLLLDLAREQDGSAADRAMRLSPRQLAEEQRNFLALLLHNGRLTLLPQIASQFEVLRAEAENVADVQVASARELTAAQVEGLCAALERRLGRRVRLQQSVDPGLLGGAVVRYGDFVVDGSLRRRVERLAAAVSGA